MTIHKSIEGAPLKSAKISHIFLTLHYIKLACNGQASNQFWSVGVLRMATRLWFLNLLHAEYDWFWNNKLSSSVQMGPGICHIKRIQVYLRLKEIQCLSCYKESCICQGRWAQVYITLKNLVVKLKGTNWLSS